MYYSGGMCYTSGEYGSADWPYSMQPQGWGGTVATGGSEQGGPAGAGSASATGQITATFIWDNEGDPADIPPPVVVLEETATASWNGDSGSCANGLGHSPTGGPGGQTSTGTTWSARNDPGYVFVVQRSPSASVSAGEASSFGPPVGGGCSVAYSVEAHTVRIGVSGVRTVLNDQGQFSHYELLVGQRLNAVVELDTELQAPNNSYAWTVSNGSPFLDYYVNHSSPWWPAIYTGWSPPSTPQMHCYFARPSNSIAVSCTVSLANVGLQVVVDASELRSIAPIVSFNVVLGAAAITNHPIYGGVYQFHLWNAIYNGVTSGVHFIGNVTTPAAFAGQGVGSWCNGQLILGTNAWYKNNAGTYFDSSWNTEPFPQLDWKFPYTAYWPADGVEHVDIDPPGFDMDSTYVECYEADQFKMYTFYKPPGADSRLVPLRAYTWSWTGHGVKSGFSWPPPTGTQSGTAQDWPDHPIWTKSLIGGTATWIERK